MNRKPEKGESALRDLVFSGDELWVTLTADGRATTAAAPSDVAWPAERFQAVGGGTVRVLEAPYPSASDQRRVKALGLRALYDLVTPDDYATIQKAFELLHWRRMHRFCGACGAALQRKNNGESAMRCESCALDYFPRINPAIIVRVTRGHEILLARRRVSPFQFYSVIAGFVEAGESLEACVAREIKEEVGIEVEGIRYFSSQPWPFPNNLMIGFTAHYKSGELQPDGDEIAEARWFRRDNLPSIPGTISISRALINDFIASAYK